MRILVDIGHPAHVHYFRNAMKELMSRGHDILITTRDKEVTLSLLESHGFSYVCTGKNKKGGFNKFLTMVRNDIAVYKAARQFKPDVFLSFFSPFAAQVGAFMGIPVIGFTDTEFAKLSIRLTLPFTNHVFTPECFSTDFGEKHFRFKGYMEHFYLHGNYFKADDSVLKDLNLEKGEPYYLLRFVSFNAGHDHGESGIDDKSKTAIVNYLSGKGRLFISSEDRLPSHFEKFRIKVSPHKFHDLLAYSRLYVGEGITTASECSLLGIPSVLINTLTTSYIDEHEKNGLLYRYTNATDAFAKIRELSDSNNLSNVFKLKSKAITDELIDCTRYLIWILEKFPDSITKLRQNPSFQHSFR